MKKNNKTIYFGGPWITSKELNSVNNSAKNGFYSGMKSDLNSLESNLNKYLNLKYSHLTFTCTHSMHLALLACGIKKNDEVIIPDLGWVATAISVLYTGAKCRFVDIDQNTLCINPESIKRAINKKTKAIMVVHCFGHPCDMKSIKKICKDYNLKLIEDAAPSMGSHIDGKKTGTFGDIGCFSFQGSKIVTGNEGGAFVTNNKKYYEFAKLFSILGRTDSQDAFWSDHLGFRYGMSNLNASLANAQLSRISQLVKRKRDIALSYYNELKNLKDILFIKEPHYGFSNYAYPNIKLLKSNKRKRNNLHKHLMDNNIHSRLMFPLTSRMPMFKKFNNPNASYCAENCLTLPSAPNITEKEILKVCFEIKKFLKLN